MILFTHQFNDSEFRVRDEPGGFRLELKNNRVFHMGDAPDWWRTIDRNADMEKLYKFITIFESILQAYDGKDLTIPGNAVWMANSENPFQDPDDLLSLHLSLIDHDNGGAWICGFKDDDTDNEDFEGDIGLDSNDDGTEFYVTGNDETQYTFQDITSAILKANELANGV